MANDNYQFVGARPPRSPHIRHGGSADNSFGVGGVVDTARYILDPDDDFARPYLAVPGSNIAYVWPLGIEGFELEDRAELGRHKYLGDIDLDVDIVHRGETNITLSGIFPGWTSVENMVALRNVFFATTDERGKVLHLPGVMPHLQYVIPESFRYTHAEEERSMDIAYSAQFVKVGTGPRAPYTGPQQPNEISGVSTAGRATHQYRTTAQVNTLRKVAMVVFKNSARWTELYAVKTNADWFDQHGVASHKAPDYRLPLGHIVYY